MNNQRLFLATSLPNVNGEEQNNRLQQNRYSRNSSICQVPPLNSLPLTSRQLRNNYIGNSIQTKGNNKRHCCGCENSNTINIIGVKNFLDKDSSIWIRIIWFIIVNTCIIITIYQIVDRIREYLAHPVIESIKISNEFEIRIPNITICPALLHFNRFRYYHISYRILSNELAYLTSFSESDIEVISRQNNLSVEHLKKRLFQAERKLENEMQFLNQSLKEDIERSLDYLQEQHFTITWPCHSYHHLRKIKESPTEEKLMEFANDKTISDKSKNIENNLDICSIKTPPQIVYHPFGKCFTFILVGKMPYKGLDTKITVDFQRERDAETTFKHDKEFAGLRITKKKGIKFVIHSGSLLSESRFFHYNRGINMNREVTLSVKSKQFHRLNRTNNLCVDYETMARCENECIQNQMTFHCRLPFMDSKLRNCTSEELISVYSKVFKIYERTMESSCTHCSRFCKKTVYSLAMTEEMLEEEDPNYDVIKIDFVFDDKNQENIYETFSYPFTVLMGDIGGCLGLFLGSCILSMLEGIVELTKSIAHYFYQR